MKLNKFARLTIDLLATMGIKNCLLLFLCVAGLISPALSQEYDINFTSLTTKDGLSSNSVTAILKDRYGVMWFGTEDGLDKFDGVHFTVYRQKLGDKTSLQSNEVLALHEDKDGNLWVGTSGGSLSLYDRKKDAFINFPAGANAITNGVILSICSDYLGNIWVANYDGINIIDAKTRRVSTFSLEPAGSPPVNRQYICVFADRQNNMWIGTTNGLFRYNLNTKITTRYFHSNTDATSIPSNRITAIAQDKTGNIWIGTAEGLSSLEPGTTTFKNYLHDQRNTSLSSNAINSIGVDGDKVWIGTSESLDIFDPKTGEFNPLRYDPRNIHSLSDKSIRCIYIDKQGIYWIGIFRAGINKYDRNLNLFNYIESTVFDDKGLRAPIVTSFVEDKSGNIYVGTEGAGLNRFNRKSKVFQHINLEAGRSPGKGLTILTMKPARTNKIVIGTFSDGLLLVDPVTGNYRQWIAGEKPEDLNSNDIFCVTEDSKGNIWVGTNGEGINVLGPNDKLIKRYTPNPKRPYDIKLPINGFIRAIKEDRDGNYWIGTHGGGLAVLEPRSGKFKIYNTSNSTLQNDKISSILEDKNGLIWIGTKGGGLVQFNKKSNTFTTFSEKDGLPNSNIYEILEDNNGLIWVSTNEGISSLDVQSKKVRNFNTHNGVQNTTFVRGAGLKLSDGQLLFGGLEGFNYFNPAVLRKNNNIPTVLITELRISNQTVKPSEDGAIDTDISIAKEINLDYKQNFALSFVGLNYTSPEQNQYAYKLEGFDKEWNYIGNSTVASYTNLDPGSYVFRVKASNNDGVWNDEGTSIKIYVHPPLWRTIYAYIFYLLLIVGFIIYLRYRGIQKLKREFALEQQRIQNQQERKEAERVQELDRLKIKFLTNLSHEFRTPISLILGPVDTLLKQDKHQQSSGQLYMIKRNGRRLLNLVNQLLDFRKMEEHELKLHATDGELVAFVKEVFDSFKDLSERKKITFVFNSNTEQFYTVFDHDKIERILFNLLSNAFKFTLEGGEIHLELEKEEDSTDISKTWASIRVRDTGIGIPEDKKEKIFERFFQNTTAAAILNQGTGIGLSITKEFVKMHGGSIELESEPGKGSTFTVRLPFSPLNSVPTSNIISPEETEQETEIEQIENFTETDGEQHPKNAGRPSILLVEDNDDFRFYLKDNLKSHYKVFEAANGKEGWQKALANHPLIIVSDISMPEMDGIELSRKIKADKRTSHIPVILLTALTGEEDQIKGLKTGANDYITKPFNFEVLNAKIRNLLELNKTLKSTYSKQISIATPEVEVESEDEKLLMTIMLYLEENLTNPQLSVEELSRHVGMSRSSLYSKLLELTGQTPVEYIRSVKLDKAAILLEKSDMNVAQVAYSVGFSTPNYFAKSFKVKFGMLPSEYINKIRKEGEKKTSNN